MTRVLERVHYFPVRHHSPRTSAVLSRFLEAQRPRLVLVEGPSDAESLLDVLLDPATRPPVAILGYRTDGTTGSALWPMASYSPEYVALKWARDHGAGAAFIDLPVGQSLTGDCTERRDDAPRTQGKSEEAHSPDPSDEAGAHLSEEYFDLEQACADSRGMRSFEEFWEASFEAPRHGVDGFRAALLAFAEATRQCATGNEDWHRAREAVMARRIAEAVVRHALQPEEVVVVAGASHVAALTVGDVAPLCEQTLPIAVPSAVTLIPFSFPRLAEQLGYGAGNRAPQYYQRAHDAGCDYRRATLEVLVEFTEHLRLRGFMASLADTIEAYRLAVMLAQIRGKAEPGLDEVREASIATMGRGDAAAVDGFLWPSVIGRNVGQVASRIGRNSLQEEFWREVRARRLPERDEPETFVLRLTNDVEVGTSIFLHRLRLSDIPYAGFRGSQAVPGRSHDAEAAGGHAALSRLREAWEARWTPSTDVALVEAITRGDSLAAVAARILEERLGAATTAGAAAEVLLESVVGGIPQTMGTALVACDRLASADDDLPSLASACRALSGLVAYGSSRTLAGASDEVIAGLCHKTYHRAVLRLQDACTGTDEAVQPCRDALRALHEIALSQPLIDRSAWVDAARRLVDTYSVNPTCSGLACGLLYLSQDVGDDEVALVVGQRLSDAAEPARAASFLAGFVDVNALVLVKSRPVVAALDRFLCGIEAERFRDVLPVLRRALGGLGATERRYLMENLFALRGIGAQARAARAVLAERDLAQLEGLGDDLAQAMDELDDLL